MLGMTTNSTPHSPKSTFKGCAGVWGWATIFITVDGRHPSLPEELLDIPLSPRPDQSSLFGPCVLVSKQREPACLEKPEGGAKGRGNWGWKTIWMGLGRMRKRDRASKHLVSDRCGSPRYTFSSFMKYSSLLVINPLLVLAEMTELP